MRRVAPRHCLGTPFAINLHDMVAGGCTWAEPVKDLTVNVIYKTTTVLIHVPAHVP
jgi:hypothetical protein